VVHDGLIEDSSPYGLDGPGLTSGLVIADGETWMLGSPGTGIAKLKCQATLIPHGLGGKGGRTENFKT
jgi:hypothetical protein